MSNRRICSYKNCKSDSTDPMCTETFFSFPRDEHRYQLWVKLSCCYDDKSKNFKQKSVKYLCSKHFDHKKYMALNPRRKLLLSTAVPYPYESDNENEDDDNYIFEVTDRQEQQVHIENNDDYCENNDDLMVEDNSNENCTFRIVKIENDDLNENNDYEGNRQTGTFENSWQYENIVNEDEVETNQEDNSYLLSTTIEACSNYKNQQYGRKKRKILNEFHELNDEICERASSREIIDDNENEKEKQNSIVSIENDYNDNDEKQNDSDDNVSIIIDNELIAHPDIKIYSIKNEEYIRMPKSVYCEEKLQLLKEIQYYKQIISDFKSKLLNVKL